MIELSRLKILIAFAFLLPLVGCATPALITAAKNGNIQAVKTELDRGVDVNNTLNRSASLGLAWNALGMAARNGHADIVKLLVDRGADVNQRMTDGWTSLMVAAYYGYDEIVRFLLEHGADRKPVNANGSTALECAKLGRHTRTAEMILEWQQNPQPRVVAKAHKPASVPALPATPVAVSPAQAPISQAANSIQSDVDKPQYSRPEAPDDFALVIGIDKYKSLPEAEFAVRDAAAVRAHLRAMGYPSRNIVYLEGPDATRTGIQSYLEEWLPRNVRPQSTIFLYYSGHGAPDPKNGDAYLVPWDADVKFLKTTAYPLKQLYASLGALKTKQVIVALDACFSGAGGRSVLAKGIRPLVTTVDQGFAPQGGMVLFAAASGDEVTSTLENQGHGMFTYFFLKGLNGEAKDGAGQVTAKGLFEYIQPKVRDEAHRQNREQTPKLLPVGEPAALILR